jgi:hypothetical protein
MPKFRVQPALIRRRLPRGRAVAPPAHYGRPWRDIMVQMMATVMIPLTVAGAGLYYTRWQQNLNDLKTMIDLVSDKDAERRKYGVAMFEYLLKNDKVPVEFVAAQLDYANASSDKDLLPQMEQALLKVSEANPQIAEVYREAASRLPVRLYVYALDEPQRACLRKILETNKELPPEKITVPDYSRATWSGQRHELRVLKEGDQAKAQALVKMFQARGLQVTMVDLSAAFANSRRFRPNTFELWFGRAPLPPVCAPL